MIKKYVKRFLAERTTEKELNSLSNRELNDIGINRSDIRSIARQTRYSEAF